MTDGSALVKVSTDLLEEYGESGASAAARVSTWLSGSVPLVDQDQLREFLSTSPLDLVHESFWRNIPFGTGGIRGPIGIGPNRINRAVVSMTIQAHCDFLNARRQSGSSPDEPSSVIVANDVREFHDLSRRYVGLSRPITGCSSRDLAVLAAEVYAGNGFNVYIMSPSDPTAILTTPELSFLIRNLGAVGGINLSASHNHPDDNGVKVYDELGGQYLPPFDEELSKATTEVASVNLTKFDEGYSTGFIRPIPEQALQRYRDMYDALFDRHRLRATGRAPIVFTPLGGCGERTLGDALEARGFRTSIPSGQRRDPKFSEIPLLAPNPEVPEATGPARRFALSQGAALVLSSDPDADRLGVEVRHGDGWVHLTGNQISTILAYFLYLDSDGPRVRGPLFTTTVTTPAVSRVARIAGVETVVDDLLIGFKYINGALHELETAAGTDHAEHQLLGFATEESHGFQMTPALREKDAMSGGLHIAALHERLTQEGQSIVDYLNRIYEEIGYFGDRGRSLVILGSAGVRTIQRLMSSLRTETPGTLGGLRVEAVTDRLDVTRFGPIKSQTDREARNLLEFVLEGDVQLEVRPSGTEPKLKFYVHTRDLNDAQGRADAISNNVYADLSSQAGIELSPPFAGLPDVLPLDAKFSLEHSVLPLIVQEAASQSSDVAIERLKQRVRDLVPGDEPLQVVGAVLAEAIPAAHEELRLRITDLAGN